MKTNRKVVRSVICVLLALIFVVSLMTLISGLKLVAKALW